MRILLIANFAPDRQESMARFCELVRLGTADVGNDVTVLRPEPVFVKLIPGPVSVRKWLGYLDKYLLFPFVLRRVVRSYDVIHICDHANVVYTHFLRGKPYLVTCHDLLAVRSALREIPENPTGWTGRVLQCAILRGLRRAEFVVCVSEKTKQDLLRLTQRDSESTSCVYNGLNYPYAPMDPDEARKRVWSLLSAKLRGEEVPRFFLHVGGNQWYKNRPGVLKIFASLRARPGFSGHRLIMVGKPFTREMRSLISNRDLGSAVTELTSLPNQDLCALYTLAEGLIFPSFEEGFGWPIIEAQACGCPVFTSNRPPMSEIGADAAVYFEPGDSDSGASAIADGLGRHPVMVERGIVNAKRFSAERMLREYRDAYLRVLKKETDQDN